MKTSLFAGIALALLAAQAAATELIDVSVTAQIPESCENVAPGPYYTAAFTFQYRGGAAILAGDSSGTASHYVDDAIMIKVVRPDGSKKTYKHLYGFDGAAEPVDLKKYFQIGANQVTVEFQDVYGGCVKSSAIWLLNR